MAASHLPLFKSDTENAKALKSKYSDGPKTYPKPIQNLPETCPKPTKTYTKPTQHLPRTYPKNLPKTFPKPTQNLPETYPNGPRMDSRCFPEGPQMVPA